MRIIAGAFKGRRLRVPKKSSTRPATDRVRESMFNWLQARYDLEGASVLDLFCGTAAIGLEAVSRGASTAIFVESNREVLSVARANAESLGVTDRCQFFGHDAIRFLEHSVDGFDVIFADPPYTMSNLGTVVDLAIPHLRSHGFFFLEHDRRNLFQSHANLVDSRKYGRTIVSIFGTLQETE